jgi:site-specific DNA-methyltransferase (adenine-specific)
MKLDETYCGDALDLVPRIVDRGSVDLAYIDPPFFTQNEQRGRSRHSGTVHAFVDRWAGIDAYRKWMRDLLDIVASTLKDSGALFLHCDWRATHHLRLLMDEALGRDNFRNEIIWHYRKWTNNRSSLQRVHQTILYYAKSHAHIPSIPLVEYSPTTNLDQIWQARMRNSDNVAVYRRQDGEAITAGPKRGVPMGDVWDLPYLNPKARERVGFPTQKPLMLLERIVQLGSPENGLVLDPCCGSGTSVVAAKLLGRHWIGIDESAYAVELTNTRLKNPIRSDSEVLRVGREAFRRQDLSREVHQALSELHVHTVHRNRLIDGYLSPEGLSLLGLPITWTVAVKVHDPTEDLNSLITKFSGVTRKKACKLGLVLSNEALMTTLPENVEVVPWPIGPLSIEAIRLQLQARQLD